ncbi:hypothetical protein D3C80_1098330 [compost metagenome]
MQAGQQDDELVAAQAGHGVDVPHLFFQALGDAFEQQVADRMAKAVVDVLETVEVEKQHGSLTFGALGTSEGRLQAVFEQRAVGQASERVVVSLVVEFRLGMFEAGNIGEHRDKVGDGPLAVAHGTDGQPAGIQLAIFAPVVDFALPVPFGGQLVPHGGIKSAVVLA